MAKKLKIVKSILPWMAIFKMGKDPIGFLVKHQKETGDLYRIDAPIKFVLVSNHEHIRHILQKNWRVYEKGAAYDGFKLLLGDGILVNNGEKWKKSRRLIQPAFSKKHVEQLAESMHNSSSKWAEQWKKKFDRNEYIEAKSDMVKFALDVLANVILGEDVAKQYNSKFIPLIQDQYDFVLKR